MINLERINCLLEGLFLDENFDVLVKEILMMFKSHYESSGVYLFEPSKQCDFLYCKFHTEDNLVINEDIKFFKKHLDVDDYLFYTKDFDVFSNFLKDDISEFRLYLLDGSNINHGFILIENPNDCSSYKEFVKMIYCLGVVVKNKANNILVKENINILKQDESLDKLLLECVHKLFYCHDLDDAIKYLLEVIGYYYKASRVLIFEYLSIDSYASITYEFYCDCLNSVREDFRGFKIVDPFWKEILVHYKGVYYHKDADYDLFVVDLNSVSNKGFLVVVNPIENNDKLSLLKSVVSYILNTFDRRDFLNRLNELSYIDEVTGLFNRNKYYESIERMERVNPLSVGVVFVDINNLKLFNDLLGHLYGDKLIHWCAYVLKKYLGNTVFRIGGDEFVYIVENISKNDFDEKIINLKLFLGQYRVDYLSVGYVHRKSYSSIESLIHEADELMYGDKINSNFDKSISKIKLIRQLKKQLKDIGIIVK